MLMLFPSFVSYTLIKSNSYNFFSPRNFLSLFNSPSFLRYESFFFLLSSDIFNLSILLFSKSLHSLLFSFPFTSFLFLIFFLCHLESLSPQNLIFLSSNILHSLFSSHLHSLMYLISSINDKNDTTQCNATLFHTITYYTIGWSC